MLEPLNEPSVGTHSKSRPGGFCDRRSSRRKRGAAGSKKKKKKKKKKKNNIGIKIVE